MKSERKNSNAVGSFGYDSFNQCKGSLQAGIGDASHAHDPHVASANTHEVPVLARPQVHHAASVVGLLVHQPVTVHHITGLAVGHLETLHDVFTVLHQIHHLAGEVLSLVDPHPEGSSVLLIMRKGVGKGN